jgi:hypothetical protein
VLKTLALEQNCASLRIFFNPSERNQQVADLLSRMGGIPAEGKYELALEQVLDDSGAVTLERRSTFESSTPAGSNEPKNLQVQRQHASAPLQLPQQKKWTMGELPTGGPHLPYYELLRWTRGADIAEAVAGVAELKSQRPKSSSPLTPWERRVAAVWESLLKRSTPIATDDDFFQCGGHSLLATRLVGRVYRELGVEMELADIFACSQLRAFASLLAKKSPHQKGGTVSIPPAPQAEFYPLSYAQQRMWVLQQSDPSSVAYNNCGFFFLHGLLGEDRLCQALEALLKLHSALRTTFIEVDGFPRQ